MARPVQMWRRCCCCDVVFGIHEGRLIERRQHRGDADIEAILPKRIRRGASALYCIDWSLGNQADSSGYSKANHFRNRCRDKGFPVLSEGRRQSSAQCEAVSYLQRSGVVQLTLDAMGGNWAARAERVGRLLPDGGRMMFGNLAKRMAAYRFQFIGWHCHSCIDDDLHRRIRTLA